MTDTAQPQAAETDAFADAASAFKVHLGQEEAPPPRDRDENGRFASAEPEEEEQDAAPEIAAETDAEDELEAPEEEGQPEGHPMPTSWAKDSEETWAALPVELQAQVVEREAQREQAVNLKFQEAANVRKASEAEFTTAQQARRELVSVYDQVIGLIVPQEPATSMLDPRSSDYNPDGYHLLKAQAQDALELAQLLAGQRQTFAAQAEAEEQRAAQLRMQQLNEASLPAFIEAVPELNDPAKGEAVLQGLLDYAVSLGAPREMFNAPTSALEWYVLWKAQQYDKTQAAVAKGNQTPPPPRKATPPVRPGVTTPRSTVTKHQRDKDFARLQKSGSIADGAAVFKHLLR